MYRPELGYYRIEGIVGCGRTGIVYLATDSRDGRAVALKVLREDVSVDPSTASASAARDRCWPPSTTRT
jgi:serine/threonine protein kinase